MNVRDLTIALRPRNSWEAVDLGAGLARRYYRDLLRIGTLGFGPFFLLLALLTWKVPLLLPFLIWWFKPLADRFYLFYLSRRIFGQEVTVRETWREWKRLLGRGSIGLLTWRRFSPTRSMTMAVSDLENLSGSLRGQRCGVISRDHGGQAVLITFGGLFLEFVGMVSVLFLANLFIPQGQRPEWDSLVVWFGQGGVWQTTWILLFGLSYGGLVLLLEPFYLANGFALYLNSRTSQEAWDIELRFRELAARVARTRVHSPAAASPETGATTQEPAGKKPRMLVGEFKKQLPLWLMVGFAFWGMSSSLRANEREPQEVVTEILAHEDFTNHVEKYKERVPNEENKKGWLQRFGDWLSGGQSSGSASQSPSAGAGAAINGFFQLLGILAILLLLTVLAILCYHLVKNRSRGIEAKLPSYKRPPPKVVMGMEVTPESLPTDLLGQARHYWDRGDPRLAMSLLYRGALAHLISEQEVSIESSDTEAECLVHVEKEAPNHLASYFGLLSRQWTQVAYSRDEVARESFDRLCLTWPFERRSQ